MTRCQSYLITAQGAILQPLIGEQLADVRIVLYIFSDGRLTCSCQIAAMRKTHSPEEPQQVVALPLPRHRSAVRATCTLAQELICGLPDL